MQIDSYFIASMIIQTTILFLQNTAIRYRSVEWG